MEEGEKQLKSVNRKFDQKDVESTEKVSENLNSFKCMDLSFKILN